MKQISILINIFNKFRFLNEQFRFLMSKKNRLDFLNWQEYDLESFVVIQLDRLNNFACPQLSFTNFLYVCTIHSAFISVYCIFMLYISWLVPCGKGVAWKTANVPSNIKIQSEIECVHYGFERAILRNLLYSFLLKIIGFFEILPLQLQYTRLRK